MILIPWIFKLGKWLNVAGSAKKRLDLVPAMRTNWENITTNQKKEMIRMASWYDTVLQANNLIISDTS